MIIANKRTIGHLALRRRNRGRYELQMMIGNPRQWNKGYGTAALRLALRRARRRHIRRIFLEVQYRNTRAIHVYEACGFLHTTPGYSTGKGRIHRTLKMEKRLA